MENSSRQNKVLRWVNFFVILAMLLYFLPYTLAPYPCEMRTIELEVRPTDQYGKLEYCAFSAHWYKSTRYYEPIESPICGQDKATTQVRAKAREAAMLAANERCQTQLPNPLDYWRDWLREAQAALIAMKG